jgi:hypothetical protein
MQNFNINVFDYGKGKKNVKLPLSMPRSRDIAVIILNLKFGFR